MKANKIISLVTILLIYAIAIAGGFLLARLFGLNIFWTLFLSDIFATIIVYISTFVFKNTSIYDPYWSFTPWVLILIEMIYCQNFSVPILILFGAFSFWSWRLTINWIITFKGMKEEDWRYAKYRSTHSVIVYELINFVGLQMMPTLLVFGATAPFILLIERGSNYFAILGAGIVILGATLELIADHQMHAFLRETTERKTCQKGLWKYSRHPNYLGEITIWFGLAICHLLQYPTQWYFDLGFVLILLLFYFISIPLMENRQVQRREDYKTYQKTTSKLLILPKRHKQDIQEVEEKD